MRTDSFLTSKDLILYKELLVSNLSRFLYFTSGNLYFPRKIPDQMLNTQKEHLPMLSDKKLFLPLIQGDKFLGIFIAQNVDTCGYEAAKPKLTEITSLCLENLAMHKAKQSDPLTGLYNKQYCICLLQRQIQCISRSLFGKFVDDHNFSEYAAHFSLILLNVDNLFNINNMLGYQYGDRVLCNVANTLIQALPPRASAARLESDNFAIVLPETNLAQSNQIAEDMRKKIKQTSINYSPTQEVFKITASFSTVHYPRDLSVDHCNRDAYEQSCLLMEQAHQSMNTAKQSGKNLVQPFSEILKNVGIVTQALTPNRVKVNLGSKFQAAAGQRFRVFSGRKAYCDNLLKGEIVLVEIGSEESTAEILYHNDPSSNMEFADRIVYIEQEQSIRHSIPKIKEQNSSGINSLEILPLEEFIQYWHSHCRHTSQFCMILCRIKEEEAEKSPDDANNEFTQLYADISRVLQTSLPAEGKIGEYSSNSLIIYMPEIDPKQAEETANKIFKPSSKKQSAPLVLGIAFYPCSHFHRTDMLINCRKAFEHALLLPSFQFAFFNSTSLTISADRHFIHNDLSNAISEYKTALLLDPQNSTAKNSLGICLAKLGQLNSAFNEFKQVAEQEPNNHFVLYNLGYTYLRLNCYPEAKQCFQKCIEHAQCTEEEEIRPEHIFSLLRLGEIAEKKQEFEQAKEFYLQALDKKQGSEYAYLFLGNLEFKLGNRENAKYYLQQALVQNPQDAEAMHLLAKIYLEQGEDPEVAESLAQKSIELRPQANDYRRLLVKALLHQNKEKEAKTLENSLGTDSNQLSLSMPT